MLSFYLFASCRTTPDGHTTEYSGETHKCTFQTTYRTLDCGMFRTTFLPALLPIVSNLCYVLNSQCLPTVEAWLCHHQKPLMCLHQLGWAGQVRMRCCLKVPPGPLFTCWVSIRHQPWLELKGGPHLGQGGWPLPAYHCIVGWKWGGASGQGTTFPRVHLCFLPCQQVASPGSDAAVQDAPATLGPTCDSCLWDSCLLRCHTPPRG